MLGLKILNYLRGYVIIQAEGFFLERFINICIRRGIFVWDIKKMGDMRMRAKVSIGAFKCIRPIAYKTKTNVKAIGKYGLPFIMDRYKNRRIAVVGLMLAIFILWYFSTHITGIDVTGNERIASDVIKMELKNFGVSIGSRVSDIDSELVQSQMMTKVDEIAWIGVNIKGSRAYIEVKERLVKLPGIDENTPCNLVAQNDGIIENLQVKEGQTVVKVKDVVEKGDLLVSGAVDSTQKGIRYVHSFGEIYATTWYEKSKEYPLDYEERIDTGKETSRYVVRILNFNVKLYLNNRQPYTYCRNDEEMSEYKSPIDIFPSIFVYRERYMQQEAVLKSRTEEEAIELGKKELEEQLLAEIPSDARVENVTADSHLMQDGSVGITVRLECIEDIAEQTLIDKVDILPYDIDNQNQQKWNQQNLTNR